MKLSLKLACIVLAAAIGLLLLSAYSLYVLRDNMVQERKAAVHLHLRMVANQVAQFQAAEKSGAFSPSHYTQVASRLKIQAFLTNERRDELGSRRIQNPEPG